MTPQQPLDPAETPADSDAVPLDVGVTGHPLAPQASSRYRRAFASPAGATGLGIILLVVVVSVVGPLFVGHSPYTQGNDALVKPGSDHLLGTDELGRDLFARLLSGTRLDLALTLIAVPISAVVGTLLGLVGLLNRHVGAAFQRLFDVLIGVPSVILGVAVTIAIMPSPTSVVIAIILVTLPVFGRQARSSSLSLVNLDYVSAAEVLGVPKSRVVIRHILPNILDVIIVRFAVEMAQAITLEGSLSVVGLGIQAPRPSLGGMIKDGSEYLTDHPLYSLSPVLVVVLMVVGYTLVANALNRAVLRR